MQRIGFRLSSALYDKRKREALAARLPLTDRLDCAELADQASRLVRNDPRLRGADGCVLVSDEYGRLDAPTHARLPYADEYGG